uniref:Small heat shock protein n=1 Tax=Lissorhoptrus oryzophilus TaxID=308863 RepID=A0A0B4L056_9CUCU|nr:small heat shock protein [Lissorhoptrus oryzophilus]
MALIPMTIERPSWSLSPWDNPSILREDEFFRPLNLEQLWIQLQKDCGITLDKNKFQAHVDVQQFRPEEIKVKVANDNTITVEGKHEEKRDDHGFISREFVRKYVLPRDCNVQEMKSKLSSDGVLVIEAPKKPEDQKLQIREIPIQYTGPINKTVPINVPERKLGRQGSVHIEVKRE